MQKNVTFNTIGQVIPMGLHIPKNLAWYPYVPHPGQLSGMIPMPVFGVPNRAGAGVVTNLQAQMNINANSGRY